MTCPSCRSQSARPGQRLRSVPASFSKSVPGPLHRDRKYAMLKRTGLPGLPIAPEIRGNGKEDRDERNPEWVSFAFNQPFF